MGSLERIAALCTLATTAVWVGGAISVPAQISLPGTTVSAPSTSVTVPSTTVRVPPTTATVSTPTTTLSTPGAKVTTPTVKSPAPKTTVSRPATTVKKAVPEVKAPSAPSADGTVDAIGGTVKQTVDSTGSGSKSSGTATNLGSTGAAGGSLAAILAGASAHELRAVREQLDGCLPALDRLQYAAANTGCAASVVGPFDAAGIGNLTPQPVQAGAVPVTGTAGDFTQARGIVGRSASPLFDLGGGGGGGPAWAIILFTVLLSASVAALTRELRHSF